MRKDEEKLLSFCLCRVLLKTFQAMENNSTPHFTGSMKILLTCSLLRMSSSY